MSISIDHLAYQLSYKADIPEYISTHFYTYDDKKRFFYDVAKALENTDIIVYRAKISKIEKSKYNTDWIITITDGTNEYFIFTCVEAKDNTVENGPLLYRVFPSRLINPEKERKKSKKIEISICIVVFVNMLFDVINLRYFHNKSFGLLLSIASIMELAISGDTEISGKYETLLFMNLFFSSCTGLHYAIRWNLWIYLIMTGVFAYFIHFVKPNFSGVVKDELYRDKRAH